MDERAGLEEQLVRLYSEYYKRFYSYAYGKLGRNAEEATDVVQWAFIDILNRGVLREYEDQVRYMYRMIHYKVVDKSKKLAMERLHITELPEEMAMEDLPDPAEHVDEQVVNSIAQGELRDLVNQMRNLKQRSYVVYKFFYDHSNDEIARLLGIPKTHLSSLRARALKELRRLYDQEMQDKEKVKPGKRARKGEFDNGH